ncbi:hypothetical protein E1B28_011901 [Marasmius oreades]|uniref:Prolyl 4-hydroxylase alpha subunit Fe(2+) 2OG dioxygenase domain-containing protein n=1 Tax=Marasmius oreades TaxID=181124 RepID=A0A9P7UQF8_9AGAR|nr:uncharacterized protein E1B28_011901 [Marasmius oreades]KAG7090303.1 hypothetical protein E1B28_011901 [Marasmius oreades]
MRKPNCTSSMSTIRVTSFVHTKTPLVAPTCLVRSWSSSQLLILVASSSLVTTIRSLFLIVAQSVILTVLQTTIAFISFYSDVEHEVLPVTSGHRVTLTYNLHFPAPLDPTALLDCPEFLPKGGLLGFWLYHSYPVKPARYQEIDHLLKLLKGEDETIRSACSELGLHTSIKTVIEDEVSCRYESWNGCGRLLMDYAKDLSQYEYWEVNDSWISFFLTDDDPSAQLVHPYNETPKVFRDRNGNPPGRLSKPIAWVTNPERKGDLVAGYDSNYISYGNEPSWGYKYIKLTLVETFGPFGKRDKYEEYEDITETDMEISD